MKLEEIKELLIVNADVDFKEQQRVAKEIQKMVREAIESGFVEFVEPDMKSTITGLLNGYEFAWRTANPILLKLCDEKLEQLMGTEIVLNTAAAVNNINRQ